MGKNTDKNKDNNNVDIKQQQEKATRLQFRAVKAQFTNKCISH